MRMNAMTRPVPSIDTVLPARNRRVAGDIRIVGMASDADDSNRQPSRVVSSCCGTVRWADRPGGRYCIHRGTGKLGAREPPSSRPGRCIYRAEVRRGAGRKERKMVTADRLARARAGDGEAFAELAE